jgi:hypothetical protein
MEKAHAAQVLRDGAFRRGAQQSASLQIVELGTLRRSSAAMCLPKALFTPASMPDERVGGSALRDFICLFA